MVSRRTETGTSARIARVACWSHSPEPVEARLAPGRDQQLLAAQFVSVVEAQHELVALPFAFTTSESLATEARSNR